jgi:FixJ family two-component response regulator
MRDSELTKIAWRVGEPRPDRHRRTLTGFRSSLGRTFKARPGTAILGNRNVVFVVDDDPGMLKGLKRLLREHGYDSVVFSSAEEFQNHDDFESACCVVLDIDLNNVSGIDLRHRLRAAGISLPVIYITANDSPTVRMAAIESGCIAYLTKPFRAKSLIEPIEKVAARAA